MSTKLAPSESTDQEIFTTDKLTPAHKQQTLEEAVPIVVMSNVSDSDDIHNSTDTMEGPPKDTDGKDDQTDVSLKQNPIETEVQPPMMIPDQHSARPQLTTESTDDTVNHKHTRNSDADNREIHFTSKENSDNKENLDNVTNSSVSLDLSNGKDDTEISDNDSNVIGDIYLSTENITSSHQGMFQPHKHKRALGCQEPKLDTIPERKDQTEKYLELAVCGLVSPDPLNLEENNQNQDDLDQNNVTKIDNHGMVDKLNSPVQNRDQNLIKCERLDEQIHLPKDPVIDKSSDEIKRNGQHSVIDGPDPTDHYREATARVHEHCNGTIRGGLVSKSTGASKTKNGSTRKASVVKGKGQSTAKSSGVKVSDSLIISSSTDNKHSIHEVQRISHSNGKSLQGRGYNYGMYNENSKNKHFYDNFSRQHKNNGNDTKLSVYYNITPRQSRTSVSRFEKPFTKLELSQALPKKSFFNCHDKTLKDAGVDTDDPRAKLKAERMKARLERISLEFNPLPNKANVNNLEKSAESVDSVKLQETEKHPMNPESPSREDNDINTHVDEFHEAQRSGNSAADLQKDHIVQMKKVSRPGSARPEYIDCKPLSSYLEYIGSNRQEYSQHIRNSRHIQADEPVKRLVKLGKIFEFRHRGYAATLTTDDKEVIMAAKALRPRTADPSKFNNSRRDKSANLWSHESTLTLRQTRPTSDDKRQQDRQANSSSTIPSSNANKEEEVPKSELEKRKVKAEDWSKSVSTSVLTRAKLQSLKELGSDDMEISKWWEALSRCRYLRQSLPETP